MEINIVSIRTDLVCNDAEFFGAQVFLVPACSMTETAAQIADIGYFDVNLFKMLHL